MNRKKLKLNKLHGLYETTKKNYKLNFSKLVSSQINIDRRRRDGDHRETAVKRVLWFPKTTAMKVM